MSEMNVQSSAASSALTELHEKLTDRRSELRVELDIPVLFRTDLMSDFEEALLVNLSNQGLLMFGVAPIRPGTQIHVLVEGNDGDQEPLLIRAEIMRTDPAAVAGYISACHVHWHGTPTTNIDMATGALGNFVSTHIKYHGSERRKRDRRGRPHERAINVSQPGKWNRRSGRGRRREESMGWC